MKAPMYYDGKKLKFEEIFRSPVASPTVKSALKVLNSIRTEHNPAYGWVELEARIEQTSQGFIAVRHHAQYE